ncbi:phosphoprotein phosphatase [Pseudozyma hubeiensis SY62]|uniref:Phosphoprotein phosphatase n=1 Tax=Pseudozyma hubeiensis (strain SY62) TaxID=1305764 RepID=R9PDA9_PSEHS|nr:phosphoprotein phosphatase [Pseudozyma hubeiensis SY62]GAC99353.1 phosphoprotein phosphatase [Pseudozyma hubeiensis SY62]
MEPLSSKLAFNYRVDSDADSLANYRAEVEGFQRWSRERGRMPRSDDRLRELEWGDLNILHSTDIHGWFAAHRKLSPPEPNYSGDWGDWASFASKMRSKARLEGRDLLLIDTGDLHDGNGISDGFPPYNKDEPGGKEAVEGHVSNQIFAMIDYDLLTIGNHELYNYTVAKDVYQNFVPQWGGRYMTSNVKIALPGPDAPNASYAPIGSLFNTLVTPVQGLKIMSYGILFDFKLAAKGIVVQSPQDMVEEDWFQQSLDRAAKWGVDAFVVLGHMPVSGDPGWEAVRTKIRSRFPDTPIAILGGHTHVRDCRMMDGQTMALESGRYMETIGFMGIKDLQKRKRAGNRGKVKFTRRYIDSNPRNFAHHLKLADTRELATKKGSFIRFIMDAISEAWNLSRLHGVVPQDYFLDRVPYGDNSSLLSLLADQVLPKVVRPSEKSRQDKKSLVLINSGSQRFDVYSGPFTRNDQYIVSPFKDRFLYMADVPWGIAKSLLHGLQTRTFKRGAVLEVMQGGTQYSDGDALLRYGSGFVEDIFVRWQKSQWFKFLQAEQADRQRAAAEADGGAGNHTHATLKSVEELEAEEDEELLKFFHKYDSLDKPSLGYRTIDQCAGPGDDTVHSPVPFNPNQPEYVASNPDPLPESDEEVVDVVFVDFMRKLMVELLNQYDLQRNGSGTYHIDQLQRWGDITTQLLYPRFAELEWQPAEGAVKAVNAQARRAGKMGYAPLANEPDYDYEEQQQQQQRRHGSVQKMSPASTIEGSASTSSSRTSRSSRDETQPSETQPSTNTHFTK